MSQSTDELAALSRIIRVIERFHELFPDSKMVSKESKDTYLKQHLSRQDWKFWEQQQTAFPEMSVNETDSLTERRLTQTQFKRLLGQYKRAGFESYQIWCQLQRPPDYGLGDPLLSC
ncbi:hypothetical protein [Spirosoma endophyticum]|uniref:Uncharacterized protein n=1 Tax=Spirosoma endophyticum TaxID=662367 RepID=A0A1I1ZBW3_9BACT|nr:hypothetical protein [Spirosoma endophyticum]SFE28828.1 hypothetical protein SAMN05216167_11266 [Spirosoma endophyticum]